MTHTNADHLSVASDFSDVSYLMNMDIEAVKKRGLPMTSEQIKLKKILHPNTKGVSILHAPVDFLKRDQCVSAFIRYIDEKPIVDILEINLPVKFVYILFTSKHTIRMDGYQMCRTIGTLFQDKVCKLYNFIYCGIWYGIFTVVYGMVWYGMVCGVGGMVTYRIVLYRMVSYI